MIRSESGIRIHSKSRSRSLPRDLSRSLLVVLLAAATLATPVRSPSSQADPALRSFTLAAAGDVLIHSRLADLAARHATQPGEWDFRPMLQSIEPWVSSADFSICHLEGVLSSSNVHFSHYPRFVAPNQIADALQFAGWDACSVASNHILDAGAAGITSTLDQLDARGIGHSGVARNPEERLPSLYDINGIGVAHLSFAQDFNGLSAPEEQPWAVNQIDVETILSDARWARHQGAEFVIVSLHWGVEYASDPVGYQHSIADALLGDPAIDLILGHHPHVVEPIGMVEGKYVVYSMGNHISNQHPAWGPDYYATNEGQLLLIHVVDGTEGPVADRIDVVPTWVRLDDLQVFAAQDALRLGIEPEHVLTRSIERTMERTLRLEAPNVRLASDPWHAVSCDGRRATILGTPSDDTLSGTDETDVIVGRAGDDTIEAGPGMTLSARDPVTIG